MHRDFWYEGRSVTPQKKDRQQRGSLNIDSDTALILVLVLILHKENPDPILTMALLYILT